MLHLNGGTGAEARHFSHRLEFRSKEGHHVCARENLHLSKTYFHNGVLDSLLTVDDISRVRSYVKERWRGNVARPWGNRCPSKDA